jgi:hypothetical protein
LPPTGVLGVAHAFPHWDPRYIRDLCPCAVSGVRLCPRTDRMRDEVPGVGPAWQRVVQLPALLRLRRITQIPDAVGLPRDTTPAPRVG